LSTTCISSVTLQYYTNRRSGSAKHREIQITCTAETPVFSTATPITLHIDLLMSLITIKRYSLTIASYLSTLFTDLGLLSPLDLLMFASSVNICGPLYLINVN
jgi:hypothetical protein